MFLADPNDTTIRMLPMPDGTYHPFRGCTLLWQTFDYIQEIYDIETEWLVKLANLDVEESGYSFKECFENILAYVCREYDAAFNRP